MSEIPASSPEPRRLLRAKDDRVIGGVCGGVARYFGIDPIIVRIAAVALIFVGGAGLIAYAAALVLVPADDGSGQARGDGPSRAMTILGAVLVVAAGAVLLDGVLGVDFGWAVGTLAPLTVVGVILAVLGQRILRNRGDQRPTAARIAGAALLLCGGVLASVALALGAAWITASGGGTAIAIVVIVLGAAMIGLSFRTPRARWLALPALVLAIPSGVVAAAGIDADGGVGERTYRPATVADLKPGGYKLGTGELQVDLRDMAWPAGDPVHLKVKVGIGHAIVLVPQDTCVRLQSHVGLGYLNVLGQESGGADMDDEHGTIDRATGSKQLVVDGDMGLGALEIRHDRNREFRHFHGHDIGPDEISAALADQGCAGERS